MQCSEVRDLTDAFIGGELLVETSHEILRHLESCPTCREDMSARRGLRTQLKAAFLNATDLAPRPEWIDTLGDRLNATTVPLARTRVSSGAWFALAATLLIAAGVATFALPGWRGASALVALARSAVGDHRNCAVRFNLAEKPIPLEQAAVYDAAYRVLETTPRSSVATHDGDIVVVDRHSCIFDGRRFAHVVMKYKGQLVSLLVTSDGAGPLTRLPSVHGVTGDTLPPADGYNVVYSHTGGHALFFIADGSVDVLHEVAAAVAGDVSRQLAGV